MLRIIIKTSGMTWHVRQSLTNGGGQWARRFMALLGADLLS